MPIDTHKDHHKAQKMLDKLPCGAVVIDRYGHAWQEGGPQLIGYWYRAYGDAKSWTSYELAFNHPLTPLTAKGAQNV